MSKEMSVIALGALVVVAPYLGIYRSWLTILLVLAGVALMVLGFLLRGEILTDEHINGTPNHPHKRSSKTFTENTAMVEQDYSNSDHN